MKRGIKKDVNSLVQVFEEFGNLFEDESIDLSALDTKVVADEEAVYRMQKMGELAKTQCEVF